MNSISKKWNHLYFLISDGSSFKYQWNKHIFSLCNENICKPSLVKFEKNENNKLAFIPVRLESSKNQINETVSLIYELDKNGIFHFIGAKPYGPQDKEGVFPKEILKIYPTDKIYTFGQSFKFINSFISNLQLIENEPIEVTQNFEPKYIAYNSTF